MIEMKEWDGFKGSLWKEEINVRQILFRITTHHMTEMSLFR